MLPIPPKSYLFGASLGKNFKHMTRQQCICYEWLWLGEGERESTSDNTNSLERDYVIRFERNLWVLKKLCCDKKSRRQCYKTRKIFFFFSFAVFPFSVIKRVMREVEKNQKFTKEKKNFSLKFRSLPISNSIFDCEKAFFPNFQERKKTFFFSFFWGHFCFFFSLQIFVVCS